MLDVYNKAASNISCPKFAIAILAKMTEKLIQVPELQISSDQVGISQVSFGSTQTKSLMLTPGLLLTLLQSALWSLEKLGSTPFRYR